MEKVRWGIVSTAAIGTVKVIPAMQQSQYCDIVAIASRSEEKAEAVAKQLGIPKAYGSYEQLLADPDIDAIYNPLPNHLHVSVSIQALEAGKHVLCEKPIGLSSAEGNELIAAGQAHPELKLMEAFMYRHHPQWQTALRIVKEGGIGTLKTIQTFFSYFNNDSGNIRNQADIGGGALMDIGCYPISLSRFIFAAEPNRVVSTVENDPQFGCDRLTSAILDFGSGVATFTCSTQLESYQRVQIFGDKGRVEIEIPFNAPPDQPCKMWHQVDEEIKEIVLETCDQYTVQGDLFSQAIINNSEVPTPIGDAVANMKVIEAIFESSKSNTWINLP